MKMIRNLLAGLVLSSAWAVCADVYWNSSSGSWSENSNWVEGVLPTAGDTVWATNLADNAIGPYEMRIANGVTAECANLNLDSFNNSWISAPSVEVEPGGVLNVSNQAYLNVFSRLHVQPNGTLNVFKLLVGLPNGTGFKDVRGAGVFVNDGRATLTTLNMRRDGIVTNNGELAVSYLQVGGDYGGGKVVFSGGVVSISKECGIANGGSDAYSAELVVTGGRITNEGSMRVAYAVRDRSNTRVTIEGHETSWKNTNTGTGNDNGVWFGKYNNSTLYATNDWFVVANGASFENACAMTFGRMAGTQSGQIVEAYVVVTNGASFTCLSDVTLANLFKASSGSTSTVKMLVDGAEAHVTNRTGTAALKLGTPMLEGGTSMATGIVEVRNGALVFCDTLAATNGAQSVANVISGTLRAKNARVDGDSCQLVGSDGESGGEWRLGAGGENRFAKGLTVKAGAALGVEIAAADNCGFADVSGQTLTFEHGAQLAVTLLDGFEPVRHQSWTIASAGSIIGMPKPMRGWRVAKTAVAEHETLVLEKADPSGFAIIVR